MKLEEIRELIQLMRENQITEIDLEEEGKRIRLVSAQAQSYHPQPITAIAASPEPIGPVLGSVAPAPASDAPKVPTTTINSPIVGTFYRSPSPESAPFVSVGDEIEEESVLGIVEAMKVMNEIKAEIKGKILEVFCANGHPVEFG